MTDEACEGVKKAAKALSDKTEAVIESLLKKHAGKRVKRDDPHPGRLDGLRQQREEFFELPSRRDATRFYLDAKERLINFRLVPGTARVEWGF